MARKKCVDILADGVALFAGYATSALTAQPNTWGKSSESKRSRVLDQALRVGQELPVAPSRVAHGPHLHDSKGPTPEPGALSPK